MTGTGVHRFVLFVPFCSRLLAQTDPAVFHLSTIAFQPDRSCRRNFVSRLQYFPVAGAMRHAILHHHDHLVCLACGKIEEFSDERIEALQREAAERKGFALEYHNLRLFGTCASCTRKKGRAAAVRRAE